MSDRERATARRERPPHRFDPWSAPTLLAGADRRGPDHRLRCACHGGERGVSDQSWSFLLIDIPLVAVSAAAGLIVTHRLRWALAGGCPETPRTVARKAEREFLGTGQALLGSQEGRMTYSLLRYETFAMKRIETAYLRLVKSEA